MAVSFGRGGRAGGGGGLTLGPPTNQFTGANKAAAEAARDAYDTANSGWLDQYDAEPTYTIILTYGTTTIYQSRRGGAWADVTGLVRGPSGEDGSSGSFERQIFQASTTPITTAPTTPASIPTADAIPTLPGGWSAAPPTGDDPIYVSIQRVARDTTNVTYTTPVRWDGTDGTPGSGTSITVQDEGTALTTAASTLNFTGGGVTATGATGVKTIDIPTAAGTDLSVSRRNNQNDVQIRSSTGSNTTIEAAEADNPGVMTSGNFNQLAALPPLWVTTETYNTGDQVSHDEKIYRSLTDSNTGNNPASDATNWGVLGTGTGTGGTTDITFLPHQWGATNNYSAGDQVAYRSKIYIANKDITGAALNGNPSATPADWDVTGRDLTDAEEAVLAQSPRGWEAGIHSVNDQAAWDGKIYECILARTAGDTDNPATDTTGWRAVSGATGGGGGISSVRTDSTIDGDGVNSDLSVHNAFTDADETLLDGVAVDVIVYYVLSNVHAEFDALDFGDTVRFTYGTHTHDATVLAGERDGNIARLIIQPIAVWSAIEAEANTTLTHGSDQLGGWVNASLQTALSDIDRSGRWYRSLRETGAGTDVWRLIDRVDRLDDTHLSLGTRSGTTLIIESSTGNDVTLPSASTTEAGLESAANNELLEALPQKWVSAQVYAEGTQVTFGEHLYRCIVARTVADTDNPSVDSTGWTQLGSGETDLALGTRTASTIEVESSTGDDVTLPAVTTTQAGLATGADKTQLNSAPMRWAAGIFSVGDQVQHDNKVYICTADRTAADTDDPETDSASWDVVIGASALDGYVNDLSSYSTTAQVTTAITNATDDVINDQGEYDSTSAYAARDLVRHDGATYLAIIAVAANTDTTTEPGSGSDWETSWYRIGFEDGPPNAFVNIQRTDNNITVTRESGENPSTITLGSGALELNELGSEAVTFASASVWTAPANAIDISQIEEGDFYAVSIRSHTLGEKLFFLPEDTIHDNVSAGGASSGRIAITDDFSTSYTNIHVYFGRTSGDELVVAVTNSEVDFTNLTIWKFGGDVADNSTRTERISFQDPARLNANATVELSPIATDPISVITPSDSDPEILSNVSGNDYTIAAGTYLFKALSISDSGSGTTNRGVQFSIRNATDDSVIEGSTNEWWAGNSIGVEAIGVINLDKDTSVNTALVNTRGTFADLDSITIEFTRWGGGRETRTVQEFSPRDLGTRTFDLDGSATSVKLTSGTMDTDDVIVVPDHGYIIAVTTVPGLNLRGSVSWHLAEDLRDQVEDTTAIAAFYTDTNNVLFFRAGAQDGGTATTGNKIIVQHIGSTRDDSGGATDATPSILTFQITGDDSPVAGSIANTTYDYLVEISQSAHVGAARIIGFIGTDSNPNSFDTLVNLNSGNFHHAAGTLTIPPGTTLTANQVYTIQLEVYPTGTVVTTAPTIYHDYRITARAPAAQTHFGLAPYTDGQTIAQVINGVVFATHDISQSGTAAGTYTFTGIGSGEYVPYWAVPTSETQPTAFRQNGQLISAVVIGNAIDRTISSVQYTIYHYELEARIDNFAEGTQTVVS